MATRYTSENRTAPDWLNFVLGIWFIISPWVLNLGFASDGGLWNGVVVGVVVALIAAFRLFGQRQYLSWTAWVSAILGVWMILSPWVWGYHINPARTWNNVIVGILVVLASLWSINANRPVPPASDLQG